MTTNVAWAPPRSNPAITAVQAPLGAELMPEDYRLLLVQRVHQMIRKEGVKEARESIRTFLPLDHEFLDLSPNQWAAHILEAGELVRARLAEQIPGNTWPHKVRHQVPQAKLALEEVDLPTWLNLAVPREHHGI